MAKHGMHGYIGPGKKQGTGTSGDSYRYSKAKPAAGANRHGFTRNPKQDSAGPMKSDPFPKPLRLVTLEVERTFTAGNLSVVPAGAGYSIKRRDGTVEDRSFMTADAAKGEILRRQPSRVA